ncbi:hypothetical protein L3i20_v246570 [Paenibacillus sp. L3-i20]|nr:hypothetical protein L3i20_v246570 [Paenibacillus sp. L3-i20]
MRENDSDISFLRNYLTKELVDELDLYIFEKKGPEWKITDKSWGKMFILKRLLRISALYLAVMERRQVESSCEFKQKNLPSLIGLPACIVAVD